MFKEILALAVDDLLGGVMKPSPTGVFWYD